MTRLNSPPSTDCFSANYFAARERFREGVEKTGGRLHVLKLDACGPKNENLTIDIGWFGSDSPKRVLLHSSGLHGVEGFAGSAIQIQFLNNLPRLPEGTALVIAHVLNPYGMAWLRRVNENNVDLNRNFLSDDRYSGAPEIYNKLNAFLNPESPPQRDLFVLRSGWLILKHGMPALKQAVVGGQYEYPKGLFFGGARLEQGPEKYQSFVTRSLVHAEQVVAIDVHTGLGKYGQDTLLVEPEEYERARALFGDRVAPSEPEKSVAYRIQGGHPSMVRRAASRAKVVVVTQEFGTYSGTKVLSALREENRWHHYGAAWLNHEAKQKLSEMFCPVDDSWRSAALERGSHLLTQAMTVLAASVPNH